MSQRVRIVTEDDVHNAVDFLQTQAAEIGRARGRLVRAEGMTKHTAALLAKFSDEKTSAAKKIDALADERYRKCIEEEAIAAAQFEEMRGLREAATSVIEIFRTEQATLRGVKF